MNSTSSSPSSPHNVEGKVKVEEDPARILVEMGFLAEEVSNAIKACGSNSSIFELSDFIHAHYGFDTKVDHQVSQENEALDATMHTSFNGKQEQDITGRLLEMGFPAEQVSDAIKACGETSSIFELSDFIQAHYGCGGEVDEHSQVCRKHEVVDAACQNNSSDDEDEDLSRKLLIMGFLPDQVSNAIKLCGNSSSIFELADFIQAHYGCDCEIGRGDRKCWEQKTLDAADDTCLNEEDRDLKRKLTRMGFPADQVSYAIKACGNHSSISELSDFIQAHFGCGDCAVGWSEHKALDAQCSKGLRAEDTCSSDFDSLCEPSESNNEDDADKRQLKRLWKDYCQLIHRKRTMLSSSDDEADSSDNEGTVISVPPRKKKLKVERGKCASASQGRRTTFMGNQTGFGLPGQVIRPMLRRLDPLVQGPPFFYFENVACMPVKSWETIKRHFHGICPEFVDSKYFSASKRSRGYVHNLPIEGRKLIIPAPPMTIQDALPHTREYWPSWDSRAKLNCIVTRRAPNTVCTKIRKVIASCEGRDPSCQEQKWILKKCKFWNLVWVGPGQVAPLEPHEIEMILGFDHEHTRGTSSMTERYTALGNSFQVNTVAYHLSPLCKLYPQGMTILTLFSGIGGAEVALHKNGIFLKAVVSVELNKKSRNVVECWWRKTNQNGRLISYEDVQELTNDVLSSLIDEFGGFDLIIGGSPCNNLSGNNRVTRSGLQGDQSCLFYEFPRILSIIKQLMLKRENR